MSRTCLGTSSPVEWQRHRRLKVRRHRAAAWGGSAGARLVSFRQSSLPSGAAASVLSLGHLSATSRPPLASVVVTGSSAPYLPISPHISRLGGSTGSSAPCRTASLRQSHRLALTRQRRAPGRRAPGRRTGDCSLSRAGEPAHCGAAACGLLTPPPCRSTASPPACVAQDCARINTHTTHTHTTPPNVRAGSWLAAAHACTPRLPAAARPRPPCAIEGRGAAAAAATAAARATARSEELTCASVHSPSVPPRCIASSPVGKTDQIPRIRSRRRESPVRVHRRHARPRRQPRGACHRPDAAHGEWTDRPSARQPRHMCV